MVSHRPLAGALFLAACLSYATPGSAREINSYALVNEDATLQISGQTVRLHGIHIPRTDRTCRTSRRPVICGSQAVLALEFRIDGFVRCELGERLQDGTVLGRCRVDASTFDEGEDLAAYLLERGWAVALPDAPIAYQTLEKIARSRGVGVWGFAGYVP
jgi:endonuclease YncB( thermonuclease family)